MKIFTEIDKKLQDTVTSEFGDSYVFLHYTGSMFGIGCRADDAKALERIKQLKGRSDNKGYIVLVPDLIQKELTSEDEISQSLPDIELNPCQQLLVEQYWPGNLTICFNLNKHQNSNYDFYKPITVKNRIALRCPDDYLLREFIRYCKKPIISTSINVNGEQPLDNLDDILKLDWFDFGIINEGVIKRSLRGAFPSTIVGFEGKELTCFREGSIPFSDVKQSYSEPLILFVCTGNICRSPMAEYYARDLFRKSGLSFRTESAGVFAGSRPISSNSGALLNQDDINSDAHFSQQIKKSLLQRSWLILTMEELHKTILINHFPAMKHKVFTLAEYCDETDDISDPFSGDLDFYADTYTLIKRYVHKLADKLAHRFKDCR